MIINERICDCCGTRFKVPQNNIYKDIRHVICHKTTINGKDFPAEVTIHAAYPGETAVVRSDGLPCHPNDLCNECKKKFLKSALEYINRYEK